MTDCRIHLESPLVLSPGPGLGLWSLVLGPSGTDLGPDLDLDLSLTIDIYGLGHMDCKSSFKFLIIQMLDRENYFPHLLITFCLISIFN